MFLREYKPKTPSLRLKKDIYKMAPFIEKNKLFNFKYKNKSGRSNKGNIIVRHKGGNIYNRYIKINLNRIYNTSLAIILSLNYLNKNSCFLGLIKHTNNSLSYIKLSNGLFVGDYTKAISNPITYSYKFNYILGSFTFLKIAPINSVYSNIFNVNSNKPIYCRSAGTYLSLIRIIDETDIFVLKLSTGSIKYFNPFSKVTIGRNSNYLNNFVNLGKAGINRLKGWRPTVRGVAMNPVDHPHGGRTKTNKPEVSPWGWIAKKNK